MSTRILLNSRRGKRSVDVDNNINIRLSTTERILPYGDAIHDVDLYEVYNKERDKSNKYRLIFTINPVCSNVLFNSVTEIIKDEGGSNTIVLPKREKVATDSVWPEYQYDGCILSINDAYVPNAKSKEDVYTTQAIRDTEYSHKDIGTYTYHCGYDIFNNHIVRSKGFNIVNKRDDKENEISVDDKTLWVYEGEDIVESETSYFKDTFNTIRDNARDKDGKPVKEYILSQAKTRKEMNKESIHLYQYDTIMTFNESTFTNLVESNGWFGFVNKSAIELFNHKVGGEDIVINKCMNNKKPCEHVDMYPDRTMYSFVPKINEHRNNRVEPNWDFCLTYPFSSTTQICERVKKWEEDEESGEFHVKNETVYTEYNPISEINGNKPINGLKIEHFRVSPFNNGSERVYFNTTVKHNLKLNGKIQLYYKFGGGNTIEMSETESGETLVNGASEYTKLPYLLTVSGLGDQSGADKEHWFSVNLDECRDILVKATEDGEDEEIRSENEITIRFCRNVGGLDCKYYFRLFKKIPNFKHSGLNVEDNGFLMTDEIIEKNNKGGFDFILNKLAFSSNIYDDPTSQVIFTDDVVLTKLKDNLNRPLSEIFFTVVKRNKGYKRWYSWDKERPITNWKDALKKYRNSEVEFSHAFGKITSGLLLEKEWSGEKYSNVRFLNNINDSHADIDESGRVKYGCYKDTPIVISVPRSPMPLEDVYWDKESENESNEKSTLVDDDGITIEGGFGEGIFLGDLVEFSPSEVTETILEDVFHRFNTAQREVTNPLYCDVIYDDIAQDDYEIDVEEKGENTSPFRVIQDYANKVPGNGTMFDGNLYPEGYFYKPHYRMKVREFDDSVKQGYDIRMGYKTIEQNIDKKVYKVKTAVNYYLNINDKIYLFNSKTNEKIDALVIGVEKLTIVTFKLEGKNEGINLKEYRLFKNNPEKPYYAYPLNDSSGRYLWRDVLAPSKVPNDSDVYDMTFTNGASYIHMNINFFVRRQDPFNEYGLHIDNSPMTDLIVKGKRKDVAIYEYVKEEDNTSC